MAVIHGTNSADTLYGTNDADRIIDLDGNDIVYAFGGDDILESGFGADWLDGGDGIDTVDFSRYSFSGNMIVNLETGYGYGVNAEGDRYVNIENVISRNNVYETETIVGNSVANSIWGLRGDDFIEGRGGDDKLYGGEQNDWLNGGTGNDWLSGGSGADYLEGSSGTDTADYSDSTGKVTISLSGHYGVGAEAEGDRLYNIENVIGGAYGDILIGSTAGNVLTGGGGADFIAGGGSGDTMYGGDGIDTVSYLDSPSGVTVIFNGTVSGGDAQGDILSGFENISGSQYADLLAGDAGANDLRGNGGADEIKGADGADFLVGGAGVDLLRGGAGDDTYIYDNEDIFDEGYLGSGGYDTIQAIASVDMSNAARFKGQIEVLRLLGVTNLDGTGNGDDNTIYGNTGVNTLTGGAGNDFLDGGAGGDTLRGGSGNDTYVIDSLLDRVNESIVGSSGIDTVQANFAFSLANTTVISGAVENLTLIGSANINGSGNALNNVIYGNSGINLLSGGGGNDFISGGGGADTFRGGAGNDTYYIDLNDIVDESIAGSGGIDTIQIAATYDLASPSTTVKGTIENLILAGTGNFDGRGSSLNNVITGNSGANTLYGRAGNDILDGKSGADVMYGGTGNDAFHVSVAEDVVVETSGQGTDRILSEVDYVLASGVSIEVLSTRSYAGTAAIDLTGNELAQRIVGNAGANILLGMGGADILNGGLGADRLDGGSGADTATYTDAAKGVTANLKSPSSNTNDAKGDSYSSIENLMGGRHNDILVGNDGANTVAGGKGDDRIAGGLGKDVLAGNSGADIFVFNTKLGSTNIDTIDDFSVKDDTIWLDDDIFTKAGKAGDLSSAAFYIGTKAHDASDRIIYDSSSGKLWYDADGTGAIKPIQFALLDATLKMTATDFDIIA
ncbi:hypothetical protein MUO32_20185 [Shinella sp. CPCC 101442]|uniref:hypothetical protein n=1 Tax=Shinella sp. CPCC 101442 TaxID=2932265 RepID=UPI002152660E|nr:hypothetical protein [Shinella sp. CPCC 101442]MCR6501357.1 hypothetical protein [Shinella sp. CPCC 101442]